MCRLSERMMAMLKVFENDSVFTLSEYFSVVPRQYNGLAISYYDKDLEVEVNAYLRFSSYADTTPENFWPAWGRALTEVEANDSTYCADLMRNHMRELAPKMREALRVYDQQSL